jgi:hypothetical protein
MMEDGFEDALRIRLRFFVIPGCVSPLPKFSSGSAQLSKELDAFKILEGWSEPLSSNPELPNFSDPFSMPLRAE